MCTDDVDRRFSFGALRFVHLNIDDFFRRFEEREFCSPGENKEKSAAHNGNGQELLSEMGHPKPAKNVEGRAHGKECTPTDGHQSGC